MAANKPFGGFTKVLFPTDFSEVSEKAASVALEMATRYGAALHAVHVVNTAADAAGFYVPHLSFEKFDEEMTRNAVEMLRKFCTMHLKGLDNLTQEVLTGEPYKEILKAVEAQGADLVIMGSLSRSGVDHFIFGSTAERVMRKVECPILIIPPSS